MVVFEFANSFFYPVCVIAVLVQLGGVIIHTKPEAKRHGAGGGAGGGRCCAAIESALSFSSAVPFGTVLQAEFHYVRFLEQALTSLPVSQPQQLSLYPLTLYL